MSSTVCEYEQARLQRMRDNQLRLKELGIKQAVCAMDVSKSSVKVAARPKRKREAQTAGVARRSARNCGKPIPKYAPTAEPKEAKVARLSRQRSASSVRSGIDPAMFPVATFEARKEAGQLADAFATDLNKKAGREVAAAKTMMPSNVSGGFWLQNHQTVTAMMGRDSVGVGIDIELECCEPSQDAEGFKHAANAKQTRWAVRYLARKPSGSGMSGGWIFFAIDHKLTPNDCVVFEVIDDEGPKFVRLHIFR
ncbi:hypothetical protein ABBQ38_014467 [Trebouxia sp. C0009 RCD-2024]